MINGHCNACGAERSLVKFYGEFVCINCRVYIARIAGENNHKLSKTELRDMVVKSLKDNDIYYWNRIL